MPEVRDQMRVMSCSSPRQSVPVEPAASASWLVNPNLLKLGVEVELVMNLFVDDLMCWLYDFHWKCVCVLIRMALH